MMLQMVTQHRTEVKKPLEQFNTMNEFFARQLKVRLTSNFYVLSVGLVIDAHILTVPRLQWWQQ